MIVPVLGEGPDLAGLPMMVSRAAGSLEYELLVVDGDPQGSSLAHLALESSSGSAPGSRVVTLASEPGRARQMNAGASQAGGEVLLFLHADTVLPEQGLELAFRALQGGAARAGAFSLAFDRTGLGLDLVAALARLRTRLTRVPFGDQAPFLRAEFFHALGGFPEIPLMEDVALFQRIKALGEEIVILPERVSTSARRYEKDGVLRRALSNLGLRALYALGADPARLARLYENPRNHKEKP